MCAHWAVEEEPRNLDSACEGEPKRIRSGIWGLVILNEAPIVAFLFIPVRALVSHKPSHDSLCCLFDLTVSKISLFEGLKSARPGVMLGQRRCYGRFLSRAISKIPVLQWPRLQGTTQIKSADLTAVSSFP